MIPAASLLLALALPASSQAPERALDAALRAEISRSTGALRQDEHPPAYFVSLRVTDEETLSARCQMGRLSSETSSRSRKLTPDLRVGSRELDNHPLQPSSAGEGVDLPADGDEFALRHAMWTALDASYKNAVANFLRKQALRVRRGKADYETDDLSAPSPAVSRGAAAALPPDAARAREACLAASSALRARARSLSGESEVRIFSAAERLLTSEGADVSYRRGVAQLGMRAHDITEDGMNVLVSRSFIGAGPADLPSPPQLAAEAREMLADLEALRTAVSTSPMNAPALVDPSVSAALLQALAARLSGEEQRNPTGAQTFRGKVGARVLPAMLTLIDDPTVAVFGGKALAGTYPFDEQGVAPRRVVLVERGVLRGFLLSRYPIVGFAASNGHGRAAPGQSPMGRPGNLFLKADGALSEAALLRRLREECRRQGKPFGLRIRRTRNWSQQGGTGRQQAFRLSPTLVELIDARTGAATLVRDLDLVGTPIELAGRITAAGDDAEAINAIVDQESGRVPVSTIAPSLLFSEVELQRAETKPQKPPILPPPSPAPDEAR